MKVMVEDLREVGTSYIANLYKINVYFACKKWYTNKHKCLYKGSCHTGSWNPFLWTTYLMWMHVMQFKVQYMFRMDVSEWRACFCACFMRRLMNEWKDACTVRICVCVCTFVAWECGGWIVSFWPLECRQGCPHSRSGQCIVCVFVGGVLSYNHPPDGCGGPSCKGCRQVLWILDSRCFTPGCVYVEISVCTMCAFVSPCVCACVSVCDLWIGPGYKVVHVFVPRWTMSLKLA